MGVVLLTIATEHGEGRKEVLSSGKCRLRKNARIYDVKSRKEDRTLETEWIPKRKQAYMRPWAGRTGILE